MRVGVIIPAHNEENSIGRVISDLPKDQLAEIIVVNNNSSDNTQSVAKNHGAVVLSESKKGYGWACLKGIDYLADKKIDVVVFLDGDYSDSPQEIIELLKPIKQGGLDFVIGSRVLGVSQKGALLLHQRFGNKLATTLMRLFYGANYTDLGPFRAIKYDALTDLKMNDKTYGWTVEMQIKAVKKKLKYTEVPVSYKPRIGKSKVSGTIIGSFKAGFIILFWVFKSIFD